MTRPAPATFALALFAGILGLVAVRVGAHGQADAGVRAPVVADAGTRAAAAPDGGAADAGTVAGLPRDGFYRLSDATAVDRATAASVEEAIRALHPSMRDPFRSQLVTILRAPRVVRLAHGADALVITRDATVFTAAAGGPARSQAGAEGRPVQVTHRDDPGAVVQVVRNGQFQRTDRFVAEGTGIRLEVELRSGLLPRPLVSTATYARDVSSSPASDGGIGSPDGGIAVP